MGKKSSRKGAKVEREAAELVSHLTGVSVRRALGAGRADDVGDLDGLDNWCLQVAARRAEEFGQVLRHKAVTVEQQRLNRGVDYGCLLVKLPQRGGGQKPDWRFVFTRPLFDLLDEHQQLAFRQGWSKHRPNYSIVERLRSFGDGVFELPPTPSVPVEVRYVLTPHTFARVWRSV